MNDSNYSLGKLYDGVLHLASAPGRIQERLEYALSHSFLMVNPESLPDSLGQRLEKIIVELKTHGSVPTFIENVTEERASALAKEITEIYDTMVDRSHES